MLYVLDTVFLQRSKLEKSVVKKITRKIHFQYLLKKNPHVSGPMQFKPTRFKGALSVHL